MVQAKANDLAKIEYDSGFKLKFWLLMSVFYLMFFVRNVIGYKFTVVAFLVLIAFMAVVFDLNETKALLVTFIIFSPVFQYKYAILICIAVLVFKHFRNIRITAACIIGIIIMLWELIHVALFDDSLWEYVRGFSEFLCFLLVISIPAERDSDTCKISRVIGVSAIVAFSMLLIVTMQTNGMSITSLIAEGFRFGASEDIDGSFKFNYNANELGYMCNLTIAGLLINVNFKKANILDYIAIVFCTFIGLLTISRTFLICLALTFVGFVILREKSLKKKIIDCVFLALIVATTFLTVYILLPDVISNYINRFSVDDITNGRSYLYEFYNEFIFSSFGRSIFGIGMQDISGKVFELESLKVNVPHNGYQQMVIAWGIPGIVLFAIFIIAILGSTKNKGKKHLMCYLPIVLLFISILGGQFITSGFKMLSLVFVYELLVGKYKAPDTSK